MEIYLSEGTRIVTNREGNEESTSLVKTLGDDFCCLGAVITPWGDREVTIKLTKSDGYTMQRKGYMYNNCIVPDEENLFAMDLSGYMLPIHIEEKKTEFYNSRAYTVELPETCCYCEVYLYISNGVYRRIGSRSNILSRKYDQLIGRFL